MSAAGSGTAMPVVTDVQFTLATPIDQPSGLLGYVAFRLGPVLIDGVTLRRTLSGQLTLSFPMRTSGTGQRHAIVRPADSPAREVITAAVLQGLPLPGESP